MRGRPLALTPRAKAGAAEVARTPSRRPVGPALPALSPDFHRAPRVPRGPAGARPPWPAAPATECGAPRAWDPRLPRGPPTAAHPPRLLGKHPGWLPLLTGHQVPPRNCILEPQVEERGAEASWGPPSPLQSTLRVASTPPRTPAMGCGAASGTRAGQAMARGPASFITWSPGASPW